MTSQASPERDGELTELDGRDAVRFERRLAHPPERVWKAITDPGDLRAWFPAEIEGDLGSPGAELSFPFRNDEAPTEAGEVLECEQPRVLAYTWGDQTLRFELEPDGDGTRLVFTHALPREESAKTAAGWQLCFDDLEARLAGRGVLRLRRGALDQAARGIRRGVRRGPRDRAQGDPGDEGGREAAGPGRLKPVASEDEIPAWDARYSVVARACSPCS